ncbi:hypothetical protein F4808DRAFT_407166 [Astrocystis sublimbata]|nr:hypothetical protein F4808DRAFT_407166 [Astrocystis sublimbata]
MVPQVHCVDDNMKHRAIYQGIRAKSNFLCGQQIRQQSTLSQRLSVTVSPQTTQRQVLDEFRKHVLKTTKPAAGDAPEHGVAILASKDFTNWLENDDFMSALLKTLLKPEQHNHQSLHVLSGIADSLSSTRLSGGTQSGFSVLYGSSDIVVPGLWESEGFGGTSIDSSGCVSFLTNPLTRSTGALEITVPLANTVFQNGRRSTLYASRWNIGGEGSLTLQRKQPKTTQRIADKGGPVNHTLSMVPLLPLTPPRKILAGLGNIVRQVDVDGTPTPASKELEDIIPKIFEERALREPTASPKPVGVWCWVIPPRCMKAGRFDNLKLFKADSSQSEIDIASSSIELFSELLSSGCQLHRILSGGGGWGLKQGLLSLDPETSFSLPGQDDDIEAFIKSFEERNSAEPTSGLATPGSSLLFCVEPQMATTDTLSSQYLPASKNLSFGVAPSPDDVPVPSSLQGSPVEVVGGHFGISSATGLFLRTIPEFAGTARTAGNNGDKSSQSSFTTKVDVPGAYFCV